MSVEDLTALVDSVVESHAEELWKLSRFLWEHPELALQEVKAHDALCEFLEQRGFEVRRNYVLDTAFRAEFVAPGGADGPTVALMAEYDALPGIGHACGHNLIAEASVGAALAAMEAMKRSPAARGKLIVLGTPAEEICGGKELLVQKGAFSDIDAALIAHPMRQDTLRLAVNAMQQMTVHFEGRATHAAASPWEGVNAMDAAVASYVNVSLLRQQLKPESRIHGVQFTDADLSSMEPCGASTDVGNVSYEVPTIHPMFGIRTDGMNHTPAFAEASNSAEAQAPTLRAAKTLALTALDLFTDPALVSQAKAEFAEWKKARLEQRAGKNQLP
ncbi:xaa-Arg dipeptidase-like isoform X2 [Amblyomma americanum]